MDAAGRAEPLRLQKVQAGSLISFHIVWTNDERHPH
jgi:CRISPR/Cas system CSM-associated protein Csm3 (group 7 of RAMP superfamily)